MRASREIAICALTGLVLGAVSFRQVVLSRFDLLLGDVGDTRFIGVILEHWWQVFRGTAVWRSPPFFYPVQGALGYSESGFLFALPYVALRFAGAGTLLSYQLVLFALVAVGWTGTILFLRRCLGLGVLPTIAGAALFVFANPNIAVGAHVQLFAIYFIPWLAIGIWLFLRDFPKATRNGRAGGMLAAVSLPAISYTSSYVGWFSLFFLLLFASVTYLWATRRSDGAAFRRHTLWNRANWKRLAPYLALSSLCFVPFALTYVPALRLFGGRQYSEIVTMLPSPLDYVNVGPKNWLWGRPLYATFTGLGSRPVAHELVKGFPVGLVLFFLVALFYCARKTRPYRVTTASDGRIRILADGNAIDHDGRLSVLAAGLGAAILLAWLLMLKIGDVSLWWLVAKAIPGANGIRAVFRFQHVLSFPLAVVAAVGLQRLVKHIAGGARPKRTRKWMGCAVMCVLLGAEEFNAGSVAYYGKQQQREMLARIQQPPPQARVFALLPATGRWKAPYVAQIDAMIIAQRFGLSTINGYSGQFPPGWGGIYDIDKPEYLPYLVRWIRHYNLDNQQLYFLDPSTGGWLPAMSPDSPMTHTQYLMSAPLGDRDFGLELRAEEVPSRWRKNEVRQCALRVKNNSRVPWSGIGSDFDLAGRYSIRLAYRWVEAGMVTGPLPGFNNRTGLPGAVKPQAEMSVPIEITAPSQPGKYWLEIEAVQELVAWFKDKGSPGLRVDVEVR